MQLEITNDAETLYEIAVYDSANTLRQQLAETAKKQTAGELNLPLS